MRLTIEQAAERLEITKHVVNDSEQRRTYYITEEQIDRFKKGEV